MDARVPIQGRKLIGKGRFEREVQARLQNLKSLKKYARSVDFK